MNSPEETFLIECGELLSAMEDSLLQMEDTPSDPDSINAIFRAAHTIKGTGGVFGFDDLVAFTHVVENVLDKVRDNEITIDSQLIATLLSCRDHIEKLVTKAVAGESLTEDEKKSSQSLCDDLNIYLGNENNSSSELESGSNSTSLQFTDAAEHDPHGKIEVLDNENNVASDNWHISLRFDLEVLKNGMDPLSFLRYLNKIGNIVHMTTMSDGFPSLNELDPLLCYLGFEIDYSTEANKDEIEQVFEFVKDLCTLHILPPRAQILHYAKVIQSLPEQDMRIGEILIASGALTQKELDRALDSQSESAFISNDENSTPLGEMLIKNQTVPEEVVDLALEKQSSTKFNQSIGKNVLRVDANKLDSLINLVGELVISGATTNMLVKTTTNEQLIESMSNMSRLVEEIRDNALNLRMVPIGETFNRFKRVVRDVSKDIGKDIKLTIKGADTELDKTVVEKIGDPLMHLIRNAMDHGIETAEERLAAGKTAQGNVQLNAFHDSGSIVIEVSDDGRGLSRDKILARAHETGLLTDGQSLSDHEVFLLIFEAGLSTADKVTNLSGRGVGMDVVRKNIEALRGTVDVKRNQFGGTTVSMRLPLTLAIIDGFLVRVGESRYVIPLDMVNECIELEKDKQQDSGMHGYINLRDQVLPFIRLADYFDEKLDKNHMENIVVVKYGNHMAGFVVDELLGELQTVIKPMGKIIQNIKGFSGATILGSGDVAIILDVPNLVQRATQAAVLMTGGNTPSHNNLLH